MRAAGAGIREALAHANTASPGARSESGDFLEGIRAAIIDKDRRPAGNTRALAEVGADEVAAMLAPLGDRARLDRAPA